MKKASIFLHGATSAIVVTSPDIFVDEGILWIDYDNDEEECLCYPLTSIKYFRVSCIKVNPNDKT